MATALRGQARLEMNITNYLKLTVLEKKLVDQHFALILTAAKAIGVPLYPNETEALAMEAVATWIVESRKKP